MSSERTYGVANGLELRFHPDEEYYPAWHRDDDSPTDVPCFVSRGRHEFVDGTYDCVGYQFYFTQNLAIGLGGLRPESDRLGYHEHDVEVVYVLFDNEGAPRHVYFGAHGLGQGVWVAWDDCLKTETGALVVYFAWRSHATYPRSGDVTRLYGLADDLAADGGRVISVNDTNYLDAAVYAHDFGDGIVIRSEIPRIANTSISNEERIRLVRFRSEIRDRANTQYEEQQPSTPRGCLPRWLIPCR